VRHRDTWRAVGGAVVPELVHADEGEWREIEATIAHVLSSRPARLRRQLDLLLWLIAVIGRIRFMGALRDVSADRRQRFLLALQRAPLPLLRRGVWGIRTLVLMGYYTRPHVTRALGYRADARGWAARTAAAAAAEADAGQHEARAQ
jgi:hypothetical protein